MMWPDVKNLQVRIEPIANDVAATKNISISMLRLDEIDPVISGNKLFKLHFYLEEALQSSHKKIITFGGAYSNHLAATAFDCKQNNIKCIGIVRGEKPETLSHTLQFCLEKAMQFEFISRKEYNRKDNADYLESLNTKFGEHILVPEGGFGMEGVKGAQLIQNYFNANKFTHVCCAVGTATTLAGLIRSLNSSEKIIGFAALKNLNDFEERMRVLHSESKNYSLQTAYHFGGYAKKTQELISFINDFYSQNNIPLDFVYTGKMMFGVFDLIKKDFFEAGSKILCLHTGGLQGNLSLPKGTLNF